VALTTWLLVAGLVLWSVVGLAAFFTVMLAGMFSNHSQSKLTVVAILAGPLAWAVIAWMVVWNWLERRKMRRWH
jgi:hypothetical protein